MYKITVIPCISWASKAYDYQSSYFVSIGSLIKIPVRSKNISGIVIAIEESNPLSKDILKNIEIASDYILDSKYIEFCNWVSDYTLSPIGEIFSLASFNSSFNKYLPLLFYENDENVISLDKIKARSDTILKKYLPCNQNYPKKLGEPKKFTSDQLDSIEKIQILKGNQVILLEGITGSGKTAVAIDGMIPFWFNEKQILILIPEISLIPQWINALKERLNWPIFFWHHKISQSYRNSVWHWSISGKPGIVVGARSALFLPFTNLALIIIDEEHSSTYKQEMAPRYHARDMAIVRGMHENIPVVLISATPSFETIENILKGKYLHTILKRTPKYGLPAIQIIDAIQNKNFAPNLENFLAENLNNGNQTLIFLNRKGYAPLTFCKLCNQYIMCKNCSIGLIWHSKQSELKCNYCNHSEKLPENCKNCKKNTLWYHWGVGIEKLEEELKLKFPNAKIACISSEVESLDEKIEEIAQGKIDFIIATQILAQGHDFKNINAVVIVDGDTANIDPKSTERMFQIWAQIKGRCGRHEKPGKLIIQTFNPDNKLIQAFSKNSPELYNILIEQRKLYAWPPYGKLIAVIVSSKYKIKAEEFLKKLTDTKPYIPNIDFLGPAVAPISKIAKHYRWRFLIKSPNNIKLQKITKNWLYSLDIPYYIKLEIDVDPHSFI